MLLQSDGRNPAQAAQIFVSGSEDTGKISVCGRMAAFVTAATCNLQLSISRTPQLTRAGATADRKEGLQTGKIAEAKGKCHGERCKS